MAQSKAITVTDINETMRKWAPALKDFALTHFNEQRFFKSAILAISEDENLMECLKTSNGRLSLYNAMKRAYSTGLSLNPQEGKACIIAYNGSARYQVMKNGAIDIVMESGDVKKLIVESVYSADKFKIIKTSDGDKFEFEPARKNRGEVDGYFCWILDRDNVSYVKYMTQAECFEIRDQYSSMYNSKAKEKSSWFKSPKGMSKKTVIHAAIRDLNLSPKATALLAAEEQNEHDAIEVEFHEISEPITGQTQNETANKLASQSKQAPAEQQQADKQEPSPVQNKQAEPPRF